MVGDLPKNQKFPYSYCVEKDGRLEWEKVYFHKGVKTKDKVCRELELQPSQVAQKGSCDTDTGDMYIVIYMLYTLQTQRNICRHRHKVVVDSDTQHTLSLS